MDTPAAPGRFHLAMAVHQLQPSVDDYTARLGQPPVALVPGRYALWRTPEINLSVSVTDPTVAAGSLRHVGFEDPAAVPGPRQTDVNGVQWEAFTAADQDAEIVRTYGPPA